MFSMLRRPAKPIQGHFFIMKHVVAGDEGWMKEKEMHRCSLEIHFF